LFTILGNRDANPDTFSGKFGYFDLTQRKSALALVSPPSGFGGVNPSDWGK